MIKDGKTPLPAQRLRDILRFRERYTLPGANAMKPPQQPVLPLREHRQRVKVTLESIVAKTKISRRFLEAIENGEYSQLPGGVFTVNYIRQYAALVGYDAETILEDYRRRTAPPAGDEPETHPRRSEARWIRFFEFG